MSQKYISWYRHHCPFLQRVRYYLITISVHCFLIQVGLNLLLPLPLVACRLMEPSCQEHLSSGDCSPESTTPSMRHLITISVHCFLIQVRLNLLFLASTFTFGGHAVTSSDPSYGQLSCSWLCPLSRMAGALDHLKQIIWNASVVDIDKLQLKHTHQLLWLTTLSRGVYIVT